VKFRSGLLALVSSLLAFPAAAQLDVTNVDLLKLILRLDGGPGVPGVVMCVAGTNLESASVTVPAPVGGVSRQEPLLASEQFPGDFCLSEETFADVAALEFAYPPGDYVFDIVGTDRTDAISVSFVAAEPGSFLLVDTPVADASEVSPDQDLIVRWTPTVKGTPCLPASCSDGIGVFVLVEETLEEVAGADAIPPDALDGLVPAAALAPLTTYVLELETYNGTFGMLGTTEKGDSVAITRAWQDISDSVFTTPAPNMGLLGGVSLLTLAGLRGSARRRRSRAAPSE